jgi:hypothetical protein
MYLGLGLRLGSSTVAGFDADAAAYFNRAGVTDATAKTQINAFVKGVKDLGLWSSMVSWPLRSTQNAGTGTTAYSLGGLGTFNGTLSGVSLPTWSTSGIVFSSASANYINISTTLASGQLNCLAFGVGSVSSVANGNRFFDFQDQASATRRNPFLSYESFGVFTDFQLPNSGVATQQASVNLAEQLNTFLSVCGSKESGTMRVSLNGVSQVTSGGKTFNVGSSYDTARIANIFDGTVSFALLASTDFTSAQVLSLHNLYKTTLGTGLGLP